MSAPYVSRGMDYMFPRHLSSADWDVVKHHLRKKGLRNERKRFSKSRYDGSGEAGEAEKAGLYKNKEQPCSKQQGEQDPVETSRAQPLEKEVSRYSPQDNYGQIEQVVSHY